jgi:hypothetical protein
MIEQMKAYYVAQSFTLVLVNDPDVIALVESKGFDRGSKVRLGRKDDTYYDGLPQLWPALNTIRANSQFNLDFLASILTTQVSWIGDALSRNQYFHDHSPVLEFFRHLRNALSHGNQWHFTGQEPRHPARLGRFELSRELHGTRVLFEYLSTGDVLDLFDETAAHLLTLA